MVIIFLILKYPLYISNWTEEINTQNCEWTINFWGLSISGEDRPNQFHQD